MKDNEKKELMILQKRKTHGSRELDEFEKKRLKILISKFNTEKVNRSEVVAIVDSMMKAFETKLALGHVHIDVLKRVLIKKGIISNEEVEVVLKEIYRLMEENAKGVPSGKKPSLIIKP